MNRILEKTILNDSVVKMVIEAPKIAQKAKAGQFVILISHETSERIPLTIFDCDRAKGSVSVIFQIVGASTVLLNTLAVNDKLFAIVGPLGKPSELENLKKVCVIGGGVGCAIAYPIAKTLHQQNSEVCCITGFRNKDLMILKDEFQAVSDRFILMSDDGSIGQKGLVTEALNELLQKERFDEVIAIGPLPMMKYVCEVTKKYQIKTVVSMNPIMIDGTGMCGGCRLSVNGKMRFACVDGPDFDGHEVDFDEALSRLSMYRDFERHAYEKTCHLLNKEGL